MKLRRFLSIILSVTFLLSATLSFPNDTSAVSTSNIPNSVNTRMINIFNRQIEYMISLRNDAYNLENINTVTTISEISELYDFDNNLYILVECQPTGYMIFHVESGVFVEYSPITNSPYHNLNGSHRYVGPNEYYISSDAESNYYYIFDDSSSIISDNEKSRLNIVSKEVSAQLCNNAQSEVLSYINGEVDSIPTTYTFQQTTTASTYTVESNGWTYINGCNFFMNMANCGYMNGGLCGYIAAAMLLCYDRVMNGINTVPSSLITRTSDGYNIDPYLTYCLYVRGQELGYGSGTTAFSISNVVQSWLADNRIAMAHTSLLIPIEYEIVAKIECDRPVIWFGHITDQTFNDTTGNHAVIVYGYSGNILNYDFVAHFGWNGANMVYFTGILGSIYTYSEI